MCTERVDYVVPTFGLWAMTLWANMKLVTLHSQHVQVQRKVFIITLNGKFVF